MDLSNIHYNPQLKLWMKGSKILPPEIQAKKEIEKIDKELEICYLGESGIKDSFSLMKKIYDLNYKKSSQELIIETYKVSKAKDGWSVPGENNTK